MRKGKKFWYQVARKRDAPLIGYEFFSAIDGNQLMIFNGKCNDNPEQPNQSSKEIYCVNLGTFKKISFFSMNF